MKVKEVRAATTDESAQAAQVCESTMGAGNNTVNGERSKGVTMTEPERSVILHAYCNICHETVSALTLL
jgi:hypothetical protein